MENKVFSKCGQRCDLCVHYVGTTDEQRAVMIPKLNKMWDNTDWSMRCGVLLQGLLLYGLQRVSMYQSYIGRLSFNDTY